MLCEADKASLAGGMITLVRNVLGWGQASEAGKHLKRCHKLLDPPVGMLRRHRRVPPGCSSPQLLHLILRHGDSARGDS